MGKTCGIIAAIGLACLSLFCAGGAALVLSLPKPTPEQLAAAQAATERYKIENTQRRLVETLIKDRLKSPSTAKFALTPGWTDSGELVITGWVESMNSFNAPVRSQVAAFFQGGQKPDLTLIQLDDKILFDSSPTTR